MCYHVTSTCLKYVLRVSFLQITMTDSGVFSFVSNDTLKGTVYLHVIIVLGQILF